MDGREHTAPLLNDPYFSRMFGGMDRQTAAWVSVLVDRMALSAMDHMTIADLLELGGARGDAAVTMVLGVMFAALDEGSLCLSLDTDAFLRRLPPGDMQKAGDLFRVFLSNLARGRYEGLIDPSGAGYKPLVLDGAAEAKRLYFHKYYVHEKRLESRMEAFLAAPASAAPSGEQIDALIDEIYTDALAIRVGSEKKPVARDPQQIRAIRLSLAAPLAIISGGPGTGKTSLMVNILRCLVRSGLPASRIVLGAPTGRAAQRMTETLQKNVTAIRRPAATDKALLGLAGSTLHKILGYRGGRHEFYYRRGNPLPASVVVIDEVSMVDVVLLDKFLQAVEPERTKLVFLGDKNQLPSVEAGAVFAEMIPEGGGGKKFKDRFVVLDSVYRSGIRLLDLAVQANRGDFPALEAIGFQEALSLETDQWAFVRAEGFGRFQAHLHQWADVHYLQPIAPETESYAALIARAGRMTAEQLATTEQGASLLERIFAIVGRAKVLTVLRGGAYGCRRINAVVSGRLIRLLDPAAGSGADGFSGAVLMITRNDYAKGLFNGDVGVMIKDSNDAYRAFFQRSGSYVDFPVHGLTSWEPAFAITVHKSQGSEFDDVLLVMPEDETHRLLSREIVYTGITRAKKRVVLYGTRPVLNAALGRKIERQSGLTW